MPPKKMEAKMAALENEVANMKVTLAEMRAQAAADQERLVSLITQSKEDNSHVKSTEEPRHDEHSGDSESSAMKKMLQKLQGEALDEFRQSVKKVELPMFNGEDPAGWITRAEIYFRVQGTRSELKVDLAQLCMEGPTLHFFRALLDDDEQLSWEKLKEALLERYGGLGEGSVFEQLSSLRQEGSVDEYIQAFECLVAQVAKMPDEQYMGYFIHGLRDGIRGRVRSLKSIGPISRPRLLNMARAVEIEVQERRSGWSGSRVTGSRGSASWAAHSRSTIVSGTGSANSGRSQNNDWVYVRGAKEGLDKGGTGTGPRGGGRSERRQFGPRDRGVRQVSYQQIEECREKGLCFKCGGPFHPKHQCPDRQLRLMITEEEDVDEGEVQVMSVEGDEEEEDGELSLMSLHGRVVPQTSSCRTMKLKGEVQGVPILLLVDSGATHNFISHKLVKAMGWCVDPTTSLQIKLGDGFKAKTQGECKEVLVKMGEMQVAIDAMVFDLDGIDIVLGMAWLKSIGGMWVDWSKQLMCFQFNGQWIELKGEGPRASQFSALQSLLGKPRLLFEGFFMTAEGHVVGVPDKARVGSAQLNRT